MKFFIIYALYSYTDKETLKRKLISEIQFVTLNKNNKPIKTLTGYISNLKRCFIRKDMNTIRKLILNPEYRQPLGSKLKISSTSFVQELYNQKVINEVCTIRINSFKSPEFDITIQYPLGNQMCKQIVIKAFNFGGLRRILDQCFFIDNTLMHNRTLLTKRN